MAGISRNQSANDGRAPSRISTVLLDLDDTVVDSFTARVQALERVFSAANILSPTPEGFLRKLRGGQLEQALKQLPVPDQKILEILKKVLGAGGLAERGYLI